MKKLRGLVCLSLLIQVLVTPISAVAVETQGVIQATSETTQADTQLDEALASENILPDGEADLEAVNPKEEEKQEEQQVPAQPEKKSESLNTNDEEEVGNDTIVYDTIVERQDEINEYMKITNQNYFVYNEIYGTEGSARVHRLTEQVKLTGIDVYVEEFVRTSRGVNTYRLKDIGWVDARALTAYDKIIEPTKKINEYMKIINQNYYVYNKMYGMQGSGRIHRLAEQVKLTGIDVYVEEYAQSTRGVNMYRLKDIGWVDYRALSKYATIKNETPINKPMKVINKNYYVYNKPYGTQGAARVHRLSTQINKTGDDFYIERSAIAGQNVKVYYVRNVGWVDARAFKHYETLVKDKKVNLKRRVVKTGYYIYNTPYGTHQSKRVEQLKKYVLKKGYNVNITREVTTSQGVKMSYAQGIGWVDSRAVGAYATIKSEKALNTDMVVKNANYYVYNKAYGTEGFLRGKRLSTYASVVKNGAYGTKEVTTSDGLKLVYLRNIGWVDGRAVKPGQSEKMKKVQQLLNRKYNSSAYGIQVTSLTDGSKASINANTRFTAASTGKLPAIYYTQKQISTGKIAASKQFLYTDAINQMTNSYMRGGAGVLQGQPYGRYFRLDQILNWTIKYSDNQGTNFIAYHAAGRYNQTMKNEISQIIGRRWDSPFSITAKENALLMEAIYRQGGQAVGYLQNTVYDNQRIPKYLPVKVGHKIGDVYDYRHDIAIVYAKQPYILSVMTKGRSYENISILSKEIYDILK